MRESIYLGEQQFGLFEGISLAKIAYVIVGSWDFPPLQHSLSRTLLLACTHTYAHTRSLSLLSFAHFLERREMYHFHSIVFRHSTTQRTYQTHTHY
jgi:hypothetical protein